MKANSQTLNNTSCSYMFASLYLLICLTLTQPPLGQRRRVKEKQRRGTDDEVILWCRRRWSHEVGRDRQQLRDLRWMMRQCLETLRCIFSSLKLNIVSYIPNFAAERPDPHSTCCLATFALTESQMRSCGNSGAKQVRSGLKVHAAV